MNNLKIRRLEAGISQHLLASKSGIRQQILSRLERGTAQMTPDKAASLARALGCNPVDVWPAMTVDYSDEEKDLVRMFRLLGRPHRATVMAVCRTLHEQFGDDAHATAN